MKRLHANGRTVRCVRVFVAFCTFLSLTITVFHREDHDGYQATHLFFMPRRNWEMDQGRGMLYEEEHYLGLERGALAEQLTGRSIRDYEEYEEYERYEEFEEYEKYEEYEAAEREGTSSDFYTDGPALKKRPHSPNMQGNQIPVDSGELEFPIISWQADPPPIEAVGPVEWQGDTVTPPPRAT